MSKSKAQAEPCWSFVFYQNPEDPKLFTAVYTRFGVVEFEVKDAAYNVCAAAMERRLRLAPFAESAKHIAV